MKSFGLSLAQRINLKAILVERGINFKFYSQSRISAYRDANGDVWVELPGFYTSAVNFTGSLGYDL